MLHLLLKLITINRMTKLGQLSPHTMQIWKTLMFRMNVQVITYHQPTARQSTMHKTEL